MLRLMSESARGEGGRVWVPRQAQDVRSPRQIPESERYYFLEERYPEYGNLVPRDIATREIFDICAVDSLNCESSCYEFMIEKRWPGILRHFTTFHHVN